MEEVPNIAEPEIIVHTGPLTLASLDASIHGSIFRYARREKSKKKRDELYHLGWEFIPPARPYEFVLRELTFVTAEGAVSLAALVDCLRTICNCEVRLKIDPRQKGWIAALRLDQLIMNKWVKSFPNLPKEVRESWAYPLWRYSLGNLDDCRKTAERMGFQIGKIVETENREIASQISFAARTIFTEGLLNIFEHAYTRRREKVTFEAITVTPVPDVNELRKKAYVSPEELNWFEEHDGRLMIEVAVADIGRNVPATLGKAYCQDHRSACTELFRMRLGSNVDQLARAKLHHDIGHWAFDHASTRKSKKDFPDELAMLNWRGLHRALNTTAKFGGCLVMRSGQARAGYTFNRDGGTPLTPGSIKQHEFPGTTLVLRFPIIDRTTRSVASGPITKLARRVTGSVLIPESTFTVKNIKGSLANLSPGRVHTVAIAHPYRKYGENELKQLLSIIREIPPNVISIHFFCSFESSMLLEQLSAYQAEPLLGPPRLAAFYNPGENLRWKFVGIIPEGARALVSSLETTGVARIPNNHEIQLFARRLVHAYDPMIKSDETSLKLIHFNGEVSDESYHLAMQTVFIEWVKKTSHIWVYERPNEAVRLPTGRLVRRYVSVLKALYSEELFARAMGWKFSSIVRRLRRDYPDLCIVTESAASYFIARILLLEDEEDVEIFIGSLPNGSRSNRAVIVFADAVHKGGTLGSLLRRCQNCVATICAIDLREPNSWIFEERTETVEGLVSFPFDPVEVPTEADLDVKVLEVDAVTHIPYETPRMESFQIGTSQIRDSFVRDHTEIFRFGLHRSGRRVHTFSIDNDELIRLYHNELCEWVESIVSDQLHTVRKRNARTAVVIFTRTEASIKNIAALLGKRFPIRFRNVEVYTAIIPVVPSGVRELFGRPADVLLHGLQSSGSPQLFAPEPTNFLAVYLEDACVTGKTLVNFLIQVSKAGTSQLPLAVVAIPIVSRFSPAEETFYTDVCRGVSSASTGKQIPFSFQPLFRLQIRSFERMQESPIFELVSTLSNDEVAFGPRLRSYIQRINQNLSVYMSLVPKTNEQALKLQHPFFPATHQAAIVASDRTLRLRHLIALAEQNVGVLSVVLHELLSACTANDYTLLSMLAMEPDLLKASPLNRECRLDVTNLALRALSAKDVTEAVKSDGLAVIAFQGAPLLNKLDDIIPAIGAVPDLVDECLLFLLNQIANNKTSLSSLQEAIDHCKSTLAVEEYAYIRGYIKGLQETSEPSNIHTQKGALRAIRKLIATTSSHSQGHSTLKAVNNWLLRDPEKRYSTTLSALKVTISDALSTIRGAVLPALNGLLWWAERSSYNMQAALDFRQAWFRVSIDVNNLETFMAELGEGPIGRLAAQQIGDLWIGVRDNSQINAADKYLSGSLAGTHKPPVIELWAREFFCAPFDIALDIASKFNLTISLASSWEQSAEGLYVVVVPVPLRAVSQVFRLLFEDMQKHGNPNSFAMEFLLERTNHDEHLIAVFRNDVLVDDTPGSGKSQRRAKKIAQDNQFSVDYMPPTGSHEPYEARVTFSEILYIRCE